MQQIKFDSLVTLGAVPQNTVELKLNPAQLYPAHLTIDQQPQLQIHTGHGRLQVLLSAEQVKQILQSSKPATTPSATSTIAAATDVDPQISAKSATPAAPNSLQAGGVAGFDLSAVKLLARLQPTAAGHIQLTVQTLNNTLQLPLSAAQLFELLRQPPLAAGQSFSTTASPLNTAAATLLMHVSKHDGLMQVQLDGQASFKLPLQQIQGAQSWPEGKVFAAQLQLTPAGQLTLSPAPSVNKDNATAAPAVSLRPAGQAQPTASAQTNQLPALLLSNKLSQQLLPLLAQQKWPERLSSQPQPWLTALSTAQTVTSPQTLGNPAVSPQQPVLDMLHQQKSALRWQLSPAAGHFLLKLQADTAEIQIKLHQTDFNRPLSFQPQVSTNQPAPPELSKDLWRQLLPLRPAQIDPLADSPQLPAPVRQLLQWIRQQQPDGKQILDTPQLQQQLTAALQFQPLTTSAAPNTAAGAIALAISMLLGRLATTGSGDKTPQLGKDKLTQIVGQLDNAQSSQLLKQLAGHSGQLQAAQVATLEQPAAKPTEQPLFIQLPLQYDSQSRMAELSIAEQESQDGPNGQRQRQWQLTMKFNLGSAGELLAKVTLKQQQIALQFYSDQAATVQMAEKFLPLLKDRLKVQGVEVTEAGCQLGRIPEHLYRQGTSLLQVRV